MSQTQLPWGAPPHDVATKTAEQEAALGQGLFNGGQFLLARDHFIEAIGLEPDCASFHCAVARCYLAVGQFDEAGPFLQTAIRLDPKNGLAHVWLGELYLSQGMVEAALQSTERAMEINPTNTDFMLSRAWALEAIDPDASWELVQKLITRAPMTPSLARLNGALAVRYGHEAQALAIILHLLRSGVSSTEWALLFTAASLLDRAGRYDEAFALAQKANAALPSRYSAADEERFYQSLMDYFTADRLASLPRASLRSDKPVFVVGMPRSGTSLVEQILSAHPAVHGAGELDFVRRSFLCGMDLLQAEFSQFPRCFDNLITDHVDGMADLYLKPFTAMNPSASRIIDKMPLNFVHLGMISLMLPGARIIHCRRDPMDSCLSCFMTPLSKAFLFKYDLGNLGHFYSLYEKLLAHWKSAIDLPILDVFYEELVADPATQSRRMVEFLDLPWDDRCLKFHTGKQPCATSSVMQVRQPVYKTSVARWRHYEKHLAPLKAALAGN